MMFWESMIDLYVYSNFRCIYIIYIGHYQHIKFYGNSIFLPLFLLKIISYSFLNVLAFSWESTYLKILIFIDPETEQVIYKISFGFLQTMCKEIYLVYPWTFPPFYIPIFGQDFRKPSPFYSYTKKKLWSLSLFVLFYMS